MRVTGGIFKGRKIHTPKEDLKGFRPTMDKTREAIFSSLYSKIDWPNSHVLDLFAGTGAFSIESLSRGAQSACLVESNPKCIKFIDLNINAFELGTRIELRHEKVDATKLSGLKFNAVFLDPPYETVSAPKLLDSLVPLCAENAIIIYEDLASYIEELDLETLENFKLLSLKKYGTTGVIFLKFLK